MKEFSLYILAGMACYFVVVQQLYRQRAAVPRMTAMMMTMCLSMGCGVLFGYFLTIAVGGDFFTSTLLGALVGGILGAIPGVFLGLLSLLEGFFTGLMSGMMGAMVALMISTSQQLYLLHFFFILFLITLSLVMYVVAQQVTTRPLPLLFSLIRHPFYPALILLVGWMTLPVYAEMKDSSVQSIQIHASEFAYTPNNITAKKNKPITLILKNEGRQEHDLEIAAIKTTPLTNIHKASHQHDKKNNPIHLHTKPGEQTSTTFIPETSGIYQWICTLPGHKEAGMYGTFVVEDHNE
ncbi:cupredoxin domain-containing protein [Aneurinibacillus sp. REN35]|uniref:cupredoxin domain-containing protein n=1 Tax=Aneurinibacillus sp. REN35 TaxID=3237286 RepID=UPI003529CDB5